MKNLNILRLAVILGNVGLYVLFSFSSLYIIIVFFKFYANSENYHYQEKQLF